MSPWGYDPTGTTPVALPPGHIFVHEGTDLQPIFDSLTEGTIVELGTGTFYGLASSPTTPLTISNNAYGSVLLGQAKDDSLLGSPILGATGSLGFGRLGVRADGCAYGVKIYNGGSPFISRCWFNDVNIGAVDKAAAQAGLGPRDGLILDGAGVFLAEKLGCNKCRRHGLVCDSTGTEPNTTLKFDMCSFVQNGFGPAETVGYGIDLHGSLSIAEFNGGNSEGNKYGEAVASGMTSLRFRDFDFETTTADQDFVTQLIAGTCNPVIIDNCNFLRGPLVTAGKCTNTMTFSTCVGVRILPNRYSGWTNVGIIRLDEGCTNCWVDPMQLTFDSGNCWIEDYSR